MCGCLSHGPHWGPGPQPRPVPQPGTKAATLWFVAPAQSTGSHQPGELIIFKKQLFECSKTSCAPFSRGVLCGAGQQLRPPSAGPPCESQPAWIWGLVSLTAPCGWLSLSHKSHTGGRRRPPSVAPPGPSDPLGTSPPRSRSRRCRSAGAPAASPGRPGKPQCVVASCTLPTGDLAYNPGMCPDWESKC